MNDVVEELVDVREFEVFFFNLAFQGWTMSINWWLFAE